ncbi:MAG: hypothetical protein QMC77_06870 [Methanocellales archaeon]|nr:hypothetical protein [Methanocellales archaeon]
MSANISEYDALKKRYERMINVMNSYIVAAAQTGKDLTGNPKLFFHKFIANRMRSKLEEMTRAGHVLPKTKDYKEAVEAYIGLMANTGGVLTREKFEVKMEDDVLVVKVLPGGCPYYKACKVMSERFESPGCVRASILTEVIKESCDVSGLDYVYKLGLPEKACEIKIGDVLRVGEV